MKTILYLFGGLLAYKMITGKQLVTIPVAGTVPAVTQPGATTAAPNSIAPDVSGGNGTLTDVAAPANGAQQWYAQRGDDPANPSSVFIPSRYDGAHNNGGVFFLG